MKIHFIGIGGIGVSALAQYYLSKGHKISGSDLADSGITEALKKKGAKILIGKHKARNLSKDADLVIYSPAVQKDNPELKAAKKPLVRSYPEALGELTKKYFTIAVSGTHGKSTTTVMIGLVLTRAGLDPTVIVGTKVKEFGNSNFRAGKSRYLVIEADEHFASFLNYWPKIIVLTNIEADHLDFYKNLGNIKKAFREYIGHLPKDGILIANKSGKHWQADKKRLRKILKVPGDHNVSNALAALSCARVLKIPDKASFEALSAYRGSWRRFEIHDSKVNGYNIKIVSDYAHHPTEVKATIEAAREKFPRSKIWAVFQPHQYQRTYYLFDDFVKSFDAADEIILTDIYDVAGREEKKISKEISSKKLAAEIRKRGKKVHYVPDFKKLPRFMAPKIKPEDVVLIMGAGDIYTIVKEF